MNPRPFLPLVLLALVLQASPYPAQDRGVGVGTSVRQRRVALVIGNSTYTDAPLANPVNDARAVRRTLVELGFEVVYGENLVQREMKEAIRQFGEKLRSGGGGLFYFAGHGVQVRGQNYLIPVGAQVTTESEVEYEGVEIGRVLAQMGDAGNELNIVILDACRNNPFARSFRSASHGLASIDAPSGSLIAYATAPGSVASDGPGRNGLYTQELLRNMTIPGLPIEEVFKRVRISVRQQSGGKQVPWEASSLVGDFYFIVPDKTATPPKSLPTSRAADPAAFELSFWETIKNSNNPEDFRAYLREFPNGRFTALARTRAREGGPPARENGPRLLDDYEASKPAASKRISPSAGRPVIETPLAPGQRARYDVQHYRLEAQLVPPLRLLRAAADVTFTPLDNTRSVVFELNGSLKVESVERNGKALANVVQDQAGLETTGPFVKVDLGEVVQAGVPQTLRFRWSGALVTPEGGPLPTKRLAYVGTEMSYLMYAARWFPFHQYAADRATSDITISVPDGYTVAGMSDEPVAEQTRTHAVTGQSSVSLRSHRFVTRYPSLIGNFAVSRFVTRTLRKGGYELAFYVQPGSEGFVDHYAELLGDALQFYTQKYGPPAFGERLTIVQIDDASLDAYAANGVQFLSPRFFKPGPKALLDARLLRELAFQWWGLSVGLKSFDDAWISQGLAEWSSFAFREMRLRGAALEAAQRDMLLRALTFEQAATIARAPSTLDDQSAAYQDVVFYKGSMIFRLLRETLGRQRFDELMRRFFLTYKGRNASIDDFEKLASMVAGENLRYFFARWVEGVGVPEFASDFTVSKTTGGKYRVTGTVRQNVENLRLPVEILIRYQGGEQIEIVEMDDRAAAFEAETAGPAAEVIIDPHHKLLRTSEKLRIAFIANRGVELMNEGMYVEAQRQLEHALTYDKSSSWIQYNLGLVHLARRQFRPAVVSLRSALEGDLEPSWIEVWCRIKLGNAYDAQNMRAEAIAEYRKAMATGVDIDDAQSIASGFLSVPYDPRLQ